MRPTKNRIQITTQENQAIDLCLASRPFSTHPFWIFNDLYADLYIHIISHKDNVKTHSADINKSSAISEKVIHVCQISDLSGGPKRINKSRS